MVFADYFSWDRAKKNTERLERTNPKNPVLNESDEQFLQQVTSHDAPSAPLPPSDLAPKTQPTEPDSGSIALPKSTAEEEAELDQLDGSRVSRDESGKRSWASYVPELPTMPAMPSVPSMPNMPKWSSKNATSGDSATDAATTSDYPEGVKVTENIKESDDQKEVGVLLDKLNLSAINNRVFSFSNQTQKIYQDFTVVLKDMINGGPTAYHDMEKLFKENEGHLGELFAGMPPFVHTLVKNLPNSIAPAMMSSSSGNEDVKTKVESASAQDSSESRDSKKQKRYVPGLKHISEEKGAVASMLSSIVNFLKLRFPLAITGTNVVMSMSVLILLFVMFYCHKRGKETRLEQGTASVDEKDDVESSSDVGENEHDEMKQSMNKDEKGGEVARGI